MKKSCLLINLLLGHLLFTNSNVTLALPRFLLLFNYAVVMATDILTSNRHLLLDLGCHDLIEHSSFTNLFSILFSMMPQATISFLGVPRYYKLISISGSSKHTAGFVCF